MQYVVLLSFADGRRKVEYLNAASERAAKIQARDLLTTLEWDSVTCAQMHPIMDTIPLPIITWRDKKLSADYAANCDRLEEIEKEARILKDRLGFRTESPCRS